MKTGNDYRSDEAGFYWRERRCDDMFKSKGMWVLPAQMDESLGASETALEAVVVLEPDADGSNVSAACVMLRPGLAAGKEMTDRLKAEPGENRPATNGPSEYILRNSRRAL